MNDLEDRLRTGLHDLAGTVPASQDARADLDRRLTRRGRRVPVLVAAAAAVVAAVAVPVVLSRGGEPAPPAATSPPQTTTTPPVTFAPDGMMFHDRAPMVLGQFTENGVETNVELLTGSYPDGGEGYCVAKVLPATHQTRDEVCQRVPTWPVGPEPGMLVLSTELYGEGNPVKDTGPLPHLELFITTPQVTRLDVGRADGMPISVRQVTRLQGAAFFLADFDGSRGGKRYTAWDANGNVVESAIE